MAVSLFEKFVKENSLDIKVVESSEPTKTAGEAARVHKVPVSNIVKSLVVKADDEYWVCLCPGDRRLDLGDLRARLGKGSVQMAAANEVKKATGHSIGGIPPFGHTQPLKTIVVEGFDPAQPLWAAAGAADTNFQITLSELEKIVKLVNSSFSNFFCHFDPDLSGEKSH